MRAHIFRPGRRGSAAVLGPLEARVMDAVWDASQPVTVGEVMDAPSFRKKPLAYSTIKTILTNLADKGYLIKRSGGRANTFAPTQSREDFGRDVVGGVVSTLMRDYRNPLLAHLAGELADDPRSIAEFERLLAQRRKTRSHNA